MQHFFITGGAGYIGSVLIPILLAKGNKVTLLDRFYFGQKTLYTSPNLICIKQDTQEISLEQLAGIDIVIDLAAISNDPCGEEFKDLTWKVNNETRVRTAKLAKQAGVKRYILASSCSIYGAQQDVATELSPPNPLTTYAKSNLQAEKSILPLATKDFCVTALRFATVFGSSPKMRLDLVINAMAHDGWKRKEIRLQGEGVQFRPFIHVKDVASAFLCVSQAESVKINGEAFNIGNSELNLQIRTVANIIQRILEENYSPVVIEKYGKNDMRDYKVSFLKAKKVIGWVAELNIDDEIKALINNFERNTIITDKRSNTLQWYRALLKQGQFP